MQSAAVNILVCYSDDLFVHFVGCSLTSGDYWVIR